MLEVPGSPRYLNTIFATFLHVCNFSKPIIARIWSDKYYSDDSLNLNAAILRYLFSTFSMQSMWTSYDGDQTHEQYFKRDLTRFT